MAILESRVVQRSLVFPFACVLSLVVSAANAQSIGINFLGGQDSDPPVEGGMVTGTAGVPDVAQPNWNNVGSLAPTGMATDLIDNTGAATSTGMNWTAATTWSSGNVADGNEDSNLMDGYIDATTDLEGSRLFVDLTSIPYDFYDVYIYVGSDGDGRSAFTDYNNQSGTATWFQTSTAADTFTGAESYIQATATTAGTAVASNYVVYEDLGFDDLQLGLTRDSNNAGIHGIQIIEELDPQGSVEVTVNRDNGQVVLSNTTPDPIDVAGYTLLSPGGALNAESWESITDNPLDGNDWFELSAEPDELAESTLATTTIGSGQTIDFGIGAWNQYFDEDVTFQYLDPATDELVGIPVFFEGNGGASFAFGDLDFSGGTIGLADWEIVRDNFNSDFDGISAAQSYHLGDLDADGDNDVDDLLAFKAEFEMVNGAGSFAALVASVPEPGTALLGALALTAVATARKKPGVLAAIVACFVLWSLSSTAHAQSIGINFIGGQSPNPGASVEGTAGVPAVAQDNWNNVSPLQTVGEAENLIDSTGAATNVTASWVSASTWGTGNAGDGNEDGNLMDGYIDATADLPGGRMFVDLEDIPYDFYDVYVYVGSDGNDRDAFTDIEGFASTAIWFSTSSDNDTFTGPESYVQATSTSGEDPAAANYVAYEDLGFEELQVGLTRGTDNAGMFGLQIIEEIDPQLLTLRVGSNGTTSIVNDTGAAVELDYYEISSESGTLNTGGWIPLEDNPQGVGDGWEELGNLDSDLLAEFHLDGSSMIDGMGTTVGLGSAVAPSTTSGISFRYHVAGGTTRFGQVEYFAVGDVDGDYNGDGVVNAADYVLWRNTEGDSVPAGTGADGDGNGTVDQLDYDYWAARFGNTAGSGSEGIDGAAAVPEPTALALFMVAALVGLWRSPVRSTLALLIPCLALGVLFAVATPAEAAKTVDRDYQLGDDGEGAGEGEIVGSGNDFDLTFDSVGTGGAGDLQDLTPNGDPRYVIVDSGPDPRPFSNVSGLMSSFGVALDGDDYLSGDYEDGPGGLGLPSASNPDTQGVVDFSAPNPVADYTDITERGMQLWIKPTNGGSGMRQDIINDTYQYGIYITEDDTWAITHGSFGGLIEGSTFESDVPVAFDEWSHVDLHSFGTGLGVLYVDGVAVMTDAGSFASVQGHGTEGENLDISVGANLTRDDHLLTGELDDIEIYVNGENAAMNYGTFDIATDNDYLAGLLDGIDAADVNMDGSVNGDGTGPVGSDDVSAFIAGYGFEKILDGNLLADRESRENGDLNFDGAVNLLDWAILRNNHSGGASLELGALLNGTVPEPASFALLTLAIATALLPRRKHRS